MCITYDVYWPVVDAGITIAVLLVKKNGNFDKTNFESDPQYWYST